MRNVILVALGGSIGAVARYKLGGLLLHPTADWKFPLSTFVINVSGCLAAGILAGLAEHRDFFTPEVRLLLFTGLLGGYTTFSAFGMETVFLLQRQEWRIALANVAASILSCVLALWLGIELTS